MPDKDRKSSAPARIDETVRRKLEALRDDCRRHPERPVPLECIEDPSDCKTGFERAREKGMLHPIAASFSQIAGSPGASLRAYVGTAKGDPEDRVRALLERLGDLVIREPVLAAIAGVALPRLPAGNPGAVLVGAVLIRGCVVPDESEVLAAAPAWTPRSEPRTITLDELAKALDAAPKLGTLRVWRVPCVRAAIAEVCDAILRSSEIKSRAAQTPKFTEPTGSDATALRELAELDADERLPSDQLAHSIGLEPRSVRHVLERLREAGWPIDSRHGNKGGVRLGTKLTRAQREWLERKPRR